MKAMQRIAWSDDRIETMKRLWTVDGLSASQIAKHLGGITRNAVIGKLHRLGLSGMGHAHATAPGTVRVKATPEPRSPRPAKLPPLPKAGDPGVVVARTIYSSGEIKPRPLRLEVPVEVPEGSGPRPWETRRYGECAWPVNTWTPGNGWSAISCCGPTDGETPYCKHHRRELTAPTQPKKAPNPTKVYGRRAA